jgi:hypothetical protein
MYYAASAMACTPNSLSQEVGLCLGAQAGEERLRPVEREAGFSNLRRAAQTPVNLILELTPLSGDVRQHKSSAHPSDSTRAWHPPRRRPGDGQRTVP